MATPYLSLARYVPRESPVHRLDARFKLVSAALLGAAAVVSQRAAGELAVLVLLAATFSLSRLPARLVLRGVRGALWLLCFVAAANAGWLLVARRTGWAAGGEPVVAAAGELGLLLLRLFDLLLLAAVFNATTVPVDVAEALERLLRPLARLRLPVHEVGTLLVLSLSFIPVFLEEARHLAAAHRVKRGLGRWRFEDRLRAVVPLLVPLFLGVLRRADDLAVALDARCFVPGAPRTSLVPARTGASEVAALVATAGVLAACAWR